MIEVRLNFNTIAEAVAFLAGGVPSSASATVTAEKQQAARDSTAAGKAAKEAKAPTPSPAPAPEPEKAAGPDRTDVSAKIVKLAGLNQDAAVALLASFNVKRAKELADDQLAAALAAVDKALASADMG